MAGEKKAATGDVENKDTKIKTLMGFDAGRASGIKMRGDFIDLETKEKRDVSGMARKNTTIRTVYMKERGEEVFGAGALKPRPRSWRGVGRAEKNG